MGEVVSARGHVLFDIDRKAVASKRTAAGGGDDDTKTVVLESSLVGVLVCVFGSFGRLINRETKHTSILRFAVLNERILRCDTTRITKTTRDEFSIYYFSRQNRSSATILNENIVPFEKNSSHSTMSSFKHVSSTATRGSLSSIVDAGKTAILVIDVQKFCSVPGLGCWANVARQDEPYFFERVDLMTGNIKKLLDCAKQVHAERVYTYIESLTTDGRDSSLDYKLTSIGGSTQQDRRLIVPKVCGPDNTHVLVIFYSLGRGTKLVDRVSSMSGEGVVVVYVLASCDEMFRRVGRRIATSGQRNGKGRERRRVPLSRRTGLPP